MRWVEPSLRSSFAIEHDLSGKPLYAFPDRAPKAFSSEVDTGSREENASKQESRASALIQSESKML
jgi:hypothetical protein